MSHMTSEKTRGHQLVGVVRETERTLSGDFYRAQKGISQNSVSFSAVIVISNCMDFRIQEAENRHMSRSNRR